MPFDWNEFVELARILEQQAKNAVYPEAYYRSAVSRAYFSAFGHAINYAKNFLQFTPRELVEDHGRLREHLKRRRRKGDSDRLEQLRQWRNEADYLNELPWPMSWSLSRQPLNGQMASLLAWCRPKAREVALGEWKISISNQIILLARNWAKWVPLSPNNS